MNPHAEIFIVMGKTDPGAAAAPPAVDDPGSARHPGGDGRAAACRSSATTTTTHGGHAELEFTDVRVPAANLIGARGRRLRDRAGPARSRPDPPLHALDRRGGAGRRADVRAGGLERIAFGKPLAEQGVIRDWIAESRVRIEQLRLLVLKTAWLMDTVGNKGAHTEIQAIKIATPADGGVDPRQGDPGARRRRPVARTSRSPPRSRASARCVSPTVPTRCTRTRWPGPSSRSTHRAQRPDPVALNRSD